MKLAANVRCGRDYTTRSFDADASPRVHPASGHNHAAPRTPLESPCTLRTSDVSTRSEKTQAAHCVEELQVCCQTLADNPALGRLCDDVRPGLHRVEHAKHVVFYRQERGGILVSRILHERMLPERHPIEDQEERS